MALPVTWFKITIVTRSKQKEQFFNVFYYKPIGEVSPPADPQAFALATGGTLSEHITSGIEDVMTTDTGPFQTAIQLHHQGQVYDAVSGADTGAGTLEDDEEPDYAAVVIQKRTAVPGRSGRGRWYLAPVPESLTDENRLTDAGKIAYQALAAQWSDSVTVDANEWLPCLYSRKLATLQTITGVNVVEKLGTQLGRKSKSLI